MCPSCCVFLDRSSRVLFRYQQQFKGVRKSSGTFHAHFLNLHKNQRVTVLLYKSEAKNDFLL